mgnify:CR=1 FL=1
MFIDRKPTRPNRYKVTRENGEAYYVTLERADEPTVEGTPLNAETLNGLMPIPLRASVGQYLRVSQVDANGKILAVEAVNLNGVETAAV